MSFNNIIGNEDVKEYLEKCINQNNILHSYIFSGTDGIGKFLFAKEFAKNILCLNKDSHDNCDCKSCKCFEGDNHPDYNVLSNEGSSIRIDDIRNIVDKVYEKPILSSKKVYIINDSDKMTTESQNCLLKTLEEPPEFVVIILITSNENLLLNTIKSRCMTIKFKSIDDESIFSYCKENLLYDNISKNLLKSFNGSIGNAIKSKTLKEKYEQIDEFVSNFWKKNKVDLFKNKSIFTKDCIYDILDYLIVCLYSKSSEDIRYLNCIKIINNCISRLNSNCNFDMTIDNLLFELWEELNESSNRY